MNLSEQELEDMIRDNEKLIWYVINKYHRWAINDEDIYQVGLIGLWKACIYFDDSKGCKFSTFAISCIRSQIYMEIRNRKTDKEHYGKISYLSEPLNDDESLTVGDCIEGKYPFSKVELDLDFIQKRLSKRDFDLLYRYVVNGESFADIARSYGFCREWPRQRLYAIQKKVKHLMKREDYT